MKEAGLIGASMILLNAAIWRNSALCRQDLKQPPILMGHRANEILDFLYLPFDHSLALEIITAGK